MPADEVDLEELTRVAASWEAAADGLADQAARWHATTGPPEVLAFAARAAATLTGHAEAASAAARRLRDYCAAVADSDEDGARSVRCAIQAAASMSTTPIAEVTETPASNA
ncbi:Excreted virulence factor EspC, type VII ESX diderm [Tsukamurella ocularis]